MEDWAKVLGPVFGYPFPLRALFAAIGGALIAIVVIEVLRSTFYHPPSAIAPESTPAVAAQPKYEPALATPPVPKTSPAQRREPRKEGTSVEKPPAETVNSVGSVKSVNQDGGITAGNIGTINQGASDEH